MTILIGPRHSRGAIRVMSATGVARSDEGCFSVGTEAVDSWTPGPKPLCHRHPTGPHPNGLLWTPAKGDWMKSDVALVLRLPAPHLEGGRGNARIELLRRDLRAAAQFVDDDLETFEPGMALVVRGDHVPRRVVGVGLVEHVLVGFEILLALGDVAEVLGSDLVPLVRLLQPLEHALLLLLLADMHEQLDEAHAGVGQRVLELVDLAVGALPFRRGAETLDPLDQHTAIPGAVEDRPVCRRRDALPEAPQEMAALLLGGRRADAPDLGRARFQAEHDALDQAAFAGGIPAVDADDDAAAGAQMVNLQVEELVLQLLQPMLVLIVVERAVDHLHLVQNRPLTHPILRLGIVPEREGD